MKAVKQAIIFMSLVYCLAACKKNEPEVIETIPETFCNPIDISYRFCLDQPSRREAADPSIVWFKDRYFLFASKSGGYWHSSDLVNWTFIETNEIPVEEYAPTAIAIEDTLYFLASSNEKSTLYKSSDPLSGKWSVAREQLERPVWDPGFYLDDDKKLYLYWGCSNVNPIYGVEVDYKKNFSFVGQPKELLHADTANHGWEVPGDNNTLRKQAPWIEGAWVNKHNGKYYLQYAGPGTEYKSYSDAVYIGDGPLGPFTIQAHNPFAYKPGGFAAAAGHGSTFADAYQNYWHIGTSTISVKHMFERRLVLYPTFFDEQGTLHATTKYGDYPMIMPKKKINSFEEIFPGWMLLSYKKPVQVSSSIDSLPTSYMTDEDMRTYWSAQTGNAGEHVILDLEKTVDVYAVQINFAEHDTKIFGRQKDIFHRYTIEYSDNGSDWTMLVDQSKSNTDKSHPYVPLKQKIACRYIKLSNVQVPGGTFAVSGLRVFGKGNGDLPAKVTNLQAQRNASDKRSVTLTWDKAANATGYVISYGIAKDKLYQSYMVYDVTTVTINTLSAREKYYYTIEAFNESGITKSETVVE